MALLRRLLKGIERNGFEPRAGVSADVLRRFEAANQVAMPDDLREYFATLDGMNPNEYNEAGFRLWPLAEIRPATATDDNVDQADWAGYFLFADFLIYSHAYAIRLETGNSNDVRVVARSAVHVANSFAEFVEVEVLGPDLLP